MITNREKFLDEYDIEKGMKILVKDGDNVDAGMTIAQAPESAAKKKKKAEEDLPVVAPAEVMARTSGTVSVSRNKVSILFEERESRDYPIAAAARLRVQDGDYVHAGQPLTEGPLNPQDILRIQGPEAVQIYLVEEVQKVYRSQGVTINDKHIETIVRQMLRRVRADLPGDTEMLPGELVDRFKFENLNAAVLAEGGEPATAQPVLLGVTKASLNTESFPAAASSQETTRVLTEAAISGQVDRLLGLKENVIIGKLIPARAEIDLPPLPQPVVEEMALPPGLAIEDEDFERDEDDDFEDSGMSELIGELLGVDPRAAAAGSDGDIIEAGLEPLEDPLAEAPLAEAPLAEDSPEASAEE
jgi:DNA-directed RNA polymerase subunit beta'